MLQFKSTGFRLVSLDLFIGNAAFLEVLFI